MKKVSLVILDSRRREALSSLKKIGVLHVETAGKTSRELDELGETRGLLTRALSALPLESKKLKTPEKSEALVTEPADAVEISKEITQLAENIRLRREEKDKLAREIERILPWGDYDPEILKEFESRGLLVRLYEFKKEDLKKLPKTGNRFIVYKGKALTGLAWIANEEDFPKGFEPLQIPRMRLSHMETLLETKKREFRDLEALLEEKVVLRRFIENARNRLLYVMEFEQVSADLGSEGILSYLRGFVPVNRLEDLKKSAAEEGWALLIEDPAETDFVPTLVENPGWIKIIQPVFDLLGTVPGYRESDISFFFLIFFSLFFAMIIGDAAYGLMLLGLSLYFSIKAKKKGGTVPDGLILLVIMAAATVVWGAITGNWFGFEPISRRAPFSLFIVPGLSSWNPRSSETVKYITFIIGTVHICIAHIWNFLREIKKKPLIRAFAQIGWLFMVLGLYFVVLNLVLDPIKYPVPHLSIYMIALGFLMVLFLSQQEGNFFKGLLKGLGSFITTFLSSISAFSDIISYIRLFAVGLASIEIAKSFNGMAEGMMTSPLGIFFGILVVVLGHSLNMAMSGLSVVVHGVRLNMLEFSNHLGLEWSGFSYRPFGESEEKKKQSK
jgi:V/A-type H+-transporting ATPase subunit I